VQDAADGGKDGAREGGATAAEASDFTPDAILLVGESVGGEGGRIEVSVRGAEEVQASHANEELDVAEVEGLGVGGRGCVLAWAEEEEEGGASHVSDGPTIRSIGGGSHVEGVDDHGNGDGFDAGGGWVCPCVAFELAKEAEVEVARFI
jgi:hypothetical protein